MKLSQIKGERTIDVVADIIEPIANIAMDKTAGEMFTRKPLPKGKTAKQFMFERITKSLPVLLKNHKMDVITIMAAISGEDVDKYKESLDLYKLINDITELLTDEAFSAFFTSAQTTEK